MNLKSSTADYNNIAFQEWFTEQRKYLTIKNSEVPHKTNLFDCNTTLGSHKEPQYRNAYENLFFPKLVENNNLHSTEQINGKMQYR